MTSLAGLRKITLVQLPLFLFSATFFPVTAFPTAAALGGRGDAALPRRRAVPRADHRRASTWASAVSVVYLVVMGLVGLRRRAPAARRAAAQVSARLEPVLLYQHGVDPAVPNLRPTSAACRPAEAAGLVQRLAAGVRLRDQRRPRCARRRRASGPAAPSYSARPRPCPRAPRRGRPRSRGCARRPAGAGRPTSRRSPRPTSAATRPRAGGRPARCCASRASQ